jgi:hypothetical protein
MSQREVMSMHKTWQTKFVAVSIALGVLATTEAAFPQAADDATDTAMVPSAEANAEMQALHPRTEAAPKLVIPTREVSEHRTSNLFAAHSWYTPPPPPPQRAPPPPPEPTAPPLPYSYLGSFQQDRDTVYFLVRGDRAYDVKIGDLLDNTYTVDGVSNGQLMFTYLPLKTSQALQLKEAR